MQLKSVAVLGSTGSIGTQTLDVARRQNITVDVITARSNIALLEDQIRAFSPRICAVEDERSALALQVKVADTNTIVLGGRNAVIEAAAMTKASTVLNATMGIAGLEPTLAAIGEGKNIALANKETLVCAGDLVMSEAKARGVKVIPVDSEHSAIDQCLRSGNQSELERILITCSGGPFFGMKRDQLAGMTKADALAHPTWSMGAKITVDSASLMNKGLEVIEAVHLFGISPDKIDVVVHRESIIHSMVQFCDGAVIAQMGLPDMRTCIGYAVCYPEREHNDSKRLDLTALGTLSFMKPDTDTFILLPAAISAIKRGGTVPAAMNGANERAVELFLQNKISFTDIFDVVSEVAESCDHHAADSLEVIMETDAAARAAVDNYFAKH
ncbi:MAG: 1-deoxy-D-xylulose-5-phosphate reductoisomerase [Clostridia bacterium]|nr:1-deoxy-D-xylulose-5-phosphate reductoisomerase [Clostridia bacterium]